MKKLILSAALALATIVTVQAQSVVPTALNGGTNNVAAAATNTYTVDFVLPANSGAVTLQAKAALTGAGTSALAFNVGKSVDGVAYTAWTNVSITMSGTTTNQAILDVNPGGARFYRVTSVGNPNASAATNLSFTVGVSKSAQ